MKKLFGELKFYFKETILAPLFKLFEAVLELIVPLIVANIIDNGINNKFGSRYIISNCIILLLFGIVGLGFALFAQYFAAKAAVGVAANMRQRIFSKIQTFSFSELDKIGTSTLITRMTSDINQVQTGINMGLRLLLRAPIVVFGAMIMAFTIDIPSALIFAVAIPILSLVIFSIMYITVPKYKRVQNNLDKVVGHTRENLSGVRVIRAFCREEDEIKDFDNANEMHYRSQIAVGRISAIMNPATYVIINLAIVWLIYVGAVKVNSGILTQGQVIALYNYMLQILTELIKLANLIITITKATASGSRVYSVFEFDNKAEQNKDTTSNINPNCEMAIEFKNVSLDYNNTGNNTIDNISFAIKKGEQFGIIGGTGSGKTSLISLIPKYYQPTNGSVFVFGKNVNEYNETSLRRCISVVLQKAVLFKGNIKENILMGKRNATDEEIIEAIKLAQAEDVLATREEGIYANVEQGGKNFSGGQRQRLAIARSLVAKPDILILDDSSSALDFKTEANLRSAIHSLDYKPTVITVSQRASSVMHCDRILVLDNGKAVCIGKHEDLLKNCELYKEIYHSQFEEAENE